MIQKCIDNVRRCIYVHYHIEKILIQILYVEKLEFGTVAASELDVK